MGCVQSETSKKEHIDIGGGKIYSWDNKQRVDPKNLTFENCSGVTVGKLPGAVNGEQFIIQNCQNCNIYIFDWINTITIDDCSDCNIFLGPTKGSIFLRDCNDCCLVAACQQFRARDCKRINNFLCCSTQPTIEACLGIRFGCFCYHYSQLEAQFRQAGLTVFNNNWAEIHDFTPVEGEQNWTLIPQDSRVEDFLPVPTTDELSHVIICTDPLISTVPQTLGSHKISEQMCLVVFFPDGQTHQRAIYFIREMERTANILVRTKEVPLEPVDAERVFRTDSYNTVVKRGHVIGLEYSGKCAIDVCQATAKSIASETGSTGLIHVSGNEKTATKEIQQFFNYANMQLSM